MRASSVSAIALVAIASCGEQKNEPARTPKPEPPAETAAPTETSALPRHDAFDTPADALRKVLEAKPRVIGFGEYHQTLGSEHVPSALTRFRSQLLAPLKDVNVFQLPRNKFSRRGHFRGVQ